MKAAILILALGQEPGLFEDAEWRRWLRDRGVTAVLAWTGEGIANVDGGRDEDATAAMLLDLVVEADLGKALGWTGGRALANPMWIEGGGLTERDLGDLSVVSGIDAPDGPRLFELWAEQSAMDDRVSLRAGLLAFDTELALASRAALFVNGSFGGPAFMTANMPTPAYPYGFLGARLRIRPARDAYVSAVLYEGDAGDARENRYGVKVRRRDGEGLLGVAEAGWEGEGLALRAGALLHTGEFEDYGSGGTDRGLHGAYVLADVPFSDEPALGGFVRAGIVREDLAVSSWTVDAGLTWTGPWPGRPDDVLGLGVVWIEIGDDFRRAQADPGAFDREIVVELTCRIAVAPWLAVQPDVQYVRHPGGTSAVDDAVVVALRVDLLF